MRSSGWVKPLVVTPELVIISGHRRAQAALELGLETVSVEIKKFESETAELEALLLENASRLKTTEQKVREAQAWREVETAKARQRQISHLKQGNCAPVVENFPPRERGKTRDRVSRRVGLGSGKTYEKAAKVVARIDTELSQGNRAIAAALRQVLNSQSVDAAYKLLKKSHSECASILELIASGKARNTKQAQQLIEQNSFLDPLLDSLQGFSAGDRVEVNQRAENYLGQRGQVEQIWRAERQISVNLESGFNKIRFSPQELTLITKAPPSVPFTEGDLVIIDLDCTEAVEAQQRKWNGFWGRVLEISEMGVVSVDVGETTLQLFPRDLKLIDALSAQLQDVAERVLQLRSLELDEAVEIVLSFLQRREWFTTEQLFLLESIEKLYPQTASRRRAS